MSVSDIERTALLCPTCLSERRALKMWLDQRTLCYVCEYHGPIWTVQQLDD